MKHALVGVLVGAILGGVATAAYYRDVEEQTVASVIFEYRLYTTQAAARKLRMIDQGRLDTARELITMELASSVDASYRLMASAEPEIGMLAINLLPGLREAEDYLRKESGKERTYLWLREVTDYVDRAAATHQDAG